MPVATEWACSIDGMSVANGSWIKRSRLRILVLGIGCELMGDDGVGVHVVRQLRRQPRSGVLISELGTAVLDSIPLLSWADRVLVIDAIRAGGPPGTIYRGPLEDMARSAGSHSIHEFDLGSAFALMRREELPSETLVLGVEPAHISWGTELSPALRSVLPDMVQVANDCLHNWRQER